MQKDLSVIIASFNTRDITRKCISLLRKNLITSGLSYEIIIVDNASTDGSVKTLEQLRKDDTKLILNKTNLGYGKANNQGLLKAEGDFVLYLNSDVYVDEKVDFASLVSYMRKNKDIGALTVEVDLPSGSIDPASHRGFPTLWRSATYYAGLEKLLGHIPYLNRLFGGYHLVYLDKQSIHEIDSPTGAFFLSPRSVLMKLHGFDEEFFMYGEDLDLSFRIKELGYKILYYPKFKVLHYKYQSGLKKKNDPAWQKKVKGFFYDAIVIFYKKHYAKQYPSFINNIVYSFVELKKRWV